MCVEEDIMCTTLRVKCVSHAQRALILETTEAARALVALSMVNRKWQHAVNARSRANHRTEEVLNIVKVNIGELRRRSGLGERVGRGHIETHVRGYGTGPHCMAVAPSTSQTGY